MPRISDEDLQTLVDLPFNFMHAYYDRMEEKVVTAYDMTVYDEGMLDEATEATLREDAERYLANPERYEPIYDLSSSDSFRTMAAFVEQLPEGPDRTALEKALNGNKPFRRFKDAVDDTSVRLDWFRYRDAQRAEDFREEILMSLDDDEDWDDEDEELLANWLSTDDDPDFEYDDEGIFDADLGNHDLPFEYAWLEKEHGLKLSDEDVRNTPQEILDFRATLTEAELEDPAGFLRKLEPLQKKYPNDPMLTAELAGLYAITGSHLKARRLMENVEHESVDNLELMVSRIMSTDDNKEFLREIKKLDQPLDIRNYPAGTAGRYHTLEFLTFEEMAIRADLLQDRLVEAIKRLDRLVRFGFLHGDVEQPAMGIAARQLEHIIDKLNDDNYDEKTPNPLPAEELSERTQNILEASMQEALRMMKAYEAEQAAATPIRRLEPKVGRNEPCPCGSGKKYKQCCMRK